MSVGLEILGHEMSQVVDVYLFNTKHVLLLFKTTFTTSVVCEQGLYTSFSSTLVLVRVWNVAICGDAQKATRCLILLRQKIPHVFGISILRQYLRSISVLNHFEAHPERAVVRRGRGSVLVRIIPCGAPFTRCGWSRLSQNG